VSPLYRAEELWKVLGPRLSQARLATPSLGLRLEVLELAPRGERQLSLASADSKLDGSCPEKMAVLFGGLAAEVGVHAFGLLQIVDSHRPELQSVLTPVGSASVQASPSQSESSDRRETNEYGRPARGFQVVQGILPGLAGMPSNDVGEVNAVPTRLVTPPLALPAHQPGAPSARPFAVGEAFTIEGQRYRVEQVEFVHRIDGIEWWSEQPTSRDYHRLWLVHDVGASRNAQGAGAIDVLVFVDRATGKRQLQGFYD
jgi:hypothetical protein